MSTNPAEVLAQLKQIADGSAYKDTIFDAEVQHIEADEVLVNFLRSLGYGAIADAWEEVPKWYA